MIFEKICNVDEIHCFVWSEYCQTSNISCILVSNKIVDHSDVVVALPAGIVLTTSSFSI